MKEAPTASIAAVEVAVTAAPTEALTQSISPISSDTFSFQSTEFRAPISLSLPTIGSTIDFAGGSVGPTRQSPQTYDEFSDTARSNPIPLPETADIMGELDELFSEQVYDEFLDPIRSTMEPLTQKAVDDVSGFLSNEFYATHPVSTQPNPDGVIELHEIETAEEMLTGKDEEVERLISAVEQSLETSPEPEKRAFIEPTDLLELATGPETSDSSALELNPEITKVVSIEVFEAPQVIGYPNPKETDEVVIETGKATPANALESSAEPIDNPEEKMPVEQVPVKLRRADEENPDEEKQWVLDEKASRERENALLQAVKDASDKNLKPTGLQVVENYEPEKKEKSEPLQDSTLPDGSIVETVESIRHITRPKNPGDLSQSVQQIVARKPPVRLASGVNAAQNVTREDVKRVFQFQDSGVIFHHETA